MSTDLHSKKILIVEDSIEYHALIKAAIGSSTTHIYVESLSAARQQQENFDLVILDLILPDGLGYELCSEYQTDPIKKHTPIILLSVRDEITDKVLGLSMGAHDYLTKPFHPLELKARAQLRVRNESLATSAPITCGNLALNAAQFKVNINSEAIELSTLELKLLSYIIKAKGRVLTRQKILDDVWGNETYVLDRAVDSAISALRKKLISWDHSISSIYGAGYKLIKKEILPAKSKADQLGHELYNEIATIFTETGPKQIEKILGEVKQGDLNAAMRSVHTLRGAMANFTNSKSEKGLELEKQLAEGQVNQETIECFINEAKSILKEIKS